MSQVAQVEFANYGQSISKALDLIGASERLPKDGLIILKPNLTNSAPPPVTTSVRAVEAVYRYCRAHTQAEILIGERVPIPTTSFNTSSMIGTNIVPITSYTYQNVGITLGRCVINSTVGVAGLWDPATTWGLKRQTEDFGLTLGHYGVGNGAYVVLPIGGPSNARDTIGLAAVKTQQGRRAITPQRHPRAT